MSLKLIRAWSVLRLRSGCSYDHLRTSVIPSPGTDYSIPIHSKQHGGLRSYSFTSLPRTTTMTLKQGEFVGSLDCGTTYVSSHFIESESSIQSFHCFVVHLALCDSLSSTNSQISSLSINWNFLSTILSLGMCCGFASRIFFYLAGLQLARARPP